MTKIYDYKTHLLREVLLDPGEQHYLLKENLKRVREFAAEKARNQTTSEQPS